MKNLFFLVFVSSCAILPDAYHAVGKQDELKKLCDQENDAKACYLYGTYLRDKGDKENLRSAYYKKSCDMRDNDGCKLYRKYLAQAVTSTDIVLSCQAKDFQACYQGGFVAYERGEKDIALKLHTMACDINFESSACTNKVKIAEEISEETPKK